MGSRAAARRLDLRGIRSTDGCKLYDRALKRIIYEQAGVPEYWLVDEKKQTLELFALEDNAYRSLGEFTGEQRLPSRIVSHMDAPAAHFFDWSKGLL